VVVGNPWQRFDCLVYFSALEILRDFEGSEIYESASEECKGPNYMVSFLLFSFGGSLSGSQLFVWATLLLRHGVSGRWIAELIASILFVFIPTSVWKMKP